MSAISIKIDVGNAAFDPDPRPEVARMLRELADRLENETHIGGLYDINGNRVGDVKCTGRAWREAEVSR